MALSEITGMWYRRLRACSGPLAIGVSIAGTGCLDLSGSCGNVIVRELASSGDGHRAVVFERNCNATTGFSTQVSVLAAGAVLPDSSGNVFIADTNHGNAPAEPGGGPQVDIRWVASDTLEVRYDGRARVFAREAQHAGVAVRYVVDSSRAQ